MADEPKTPHEGNTPSAPAGGTQQAAPAGPTVQVPINAEDMATSYTNFFRVTGTFEELVLDFGLHTQMMT
ncbi:MAG TPA: DUF3467 domain-containing protein, partial [Gemmataceae bacterium]